MKNVKIILNWHVGDFYALSLPDLYVVKQISGLKDGLFSRLHKTDNRMTYLTGDRCLTLFNTKR